MTKFKVGVRGYTVASQAEFVEDVTNGLYCMWVEFPSGARIEGDELRSLRFTIGGNLQGSDTLGLSTIEFSYESAHLVGELDTFLPLTIVYCDRDGNPLPRRSE